MRFTLRFTRRKENHFWGTDREFLISVKERNKSVTCSYMSNPYIELGVFLSLYHHRIQSGFLSCQVYLRVGVEVEDDSG